MELSGKVAIVTGASRGIGRATALCLAEAGANVVVNYRKGREAGQEVVEEITKRGRNAITAQADVTRSAEVEAMVETTLRSFRRVDILVNNAGGSLSSAVVDMDEKEWDDVIAFNLKSAFLCCKAVLPTMIRNRYGKIVNVSSNYGVTPANRRSHYSAAKAGLIAFTRSLAVEVAPYHINVNVLAPGPTDTPRWRGNRTEAELAARARDVPWGRVGKPEDMAPAVLFLVSDASSYITGQQLHVNGGLVMP